MGKDLIDLKLDEIQDELEELEKEYKEKQKVFFDKAQELMKEKKMLKKKTAHMCPNHDDGSGYCSICGNPIPEILKLKAEHDRNFDDTIIEITKTHLHYLEVLQKNYVFMQPEVRNAINFAIVLTQETLEAQEALKITREGH